MKNPVAVFNELFYIDTEDDCTVYRCVTDGISESSKIYELRGAVESGIFAVMALKLYLSQTSNEKAEKKLHEIEQSISIPNITINRTAERNLIAQ